ncbi:MAG: M28 family peptidase [Cytophagales bacterium]|nr:M28 family peptidase [Cytophagales bacterium]MDW8383977.1 M28 family peptidase [Flammeovirgaceae bacterium]
MKWITLLYGSLLASIILLESCQRETKEQTTQEISTYHNPPEFCADSAFYYVQKQLTFGPRYLGSHGHQQCGDFLVKELERFKFHVIQQNFDATLYNGKILKARNIIGSYQPTATKRIILAAHWDTRPFADQDTIRKNDPILGANDGASGVAVLLEIARVLHNDTIPLKIGIDIIFFDAEDYGEPTWIEEKNYSQTYYCLGSQYWAKNKHIPNYRAYYGILLDMVGARNATFTMEGNSMEYAPKIVKKVWDTAERIGYSQYFVKQETPSVIDDHYFVNRYGGIPMIDIIHYNDDNNEPFFSDWHKHSDNLEQIDKNVLKAVGQTLLHVLYNE